MQERIKIRDIDRVVNSVLDELLDNDVAELESHASGSEGNHPWRFGEMVGGGGYDNFSDSNSLSLPNFPMQDYTPISEVVHPAPKVPRLQDLLITILNQLIRPPKQLMPDFLVFDMTEDFPATKINTEEEVMPIKPSIAGCGMEANGKQVQVADLRNCAIYICVAMTEHDGEEDDELLEND